MGHILVVFSVILSRDGSGSSILRCDRVGDVLEQARNIQDQRTSPLPENGEPAHTLKIVKSFPNG